MTKETYKDLFISRFTFTRSLAALIFLSKVKIVYFRSLFESRFLNSLELNKILD